MRQEVSEPIGLGQSVHRERSRWTRSSREATPALCRRPLTRETSTGRSAKVESAIRSPALAERRARRERKLSPRARGASLGRAGFVAKVTSSPGLGRKPRARWGLGCKLQAPGKPGGKLHQRATAGAVLRSSVSVVVLMDRIGCRSRQAARGHSRPCAKSAWTTRDGLAPGRESADGVK